MTREETAKRIEVMQAYVDGAEIERCGQNTGWRWEDSNSPEWYGNYEYRVKSQPKVVPYETAEEVMEAIAEHGDWIKQGGDIYRRIDKVTTIGNKVCISLSGMKDWGINELPNIEKMKFLDGAPFGKLEE